MTNPDIADYPGQGVSGANRGIEAELSIDDMLGLPNIAYDIISSDAKPSKQVVAFKSVQNQLETNSNGSYLLDSISEAYGLFTSSDASFTLNSEKKISELKVQLYWKDKFTAEITGTALDTSTPQYVFTRFSSPKSSKLGDAGEPIVVIDESKVKELLFRYTVNNNEYSHDHLSLEDLLELLKVHHPSRQEADIFNYCNVLFDGTEPEVEVNEENYTKTLHSFDTEIKRTNNFNGYNVAESVDVEVSAVSSQPISDPIGNLHMARQAIILELSVSISTIGEREVDLVTAMSFAQVEKAEPETFDYTSPNGRLWMVNQENKIAYYLAKGGGFIGLLTKVVDKALFDK